MKNVIFLSVLFLILSGCEKIKEIGENPDNRQAFHNRSVGASARELLSGDTYKSLKVEIQYMPGFAPDAAAISHLQNFLTARLNKPNGISIVTKEIAAAGNSALGVAEIKALELANRTAYSSSEEMAVYILYTNGEYTNTNTLGIAYRNTSAALFGKKIRDNSGALGQASRTKLEATVLEHELGHLLGLVDLGSPMQAPHKDAAHDHHCNSQSCLMYYASETTDILGFLVTGNIPSLDANCIADLKANGGK